MTLSRRQRATAEQALETVRGIERGRESSMYGPLRDLLAIGLGYDRRRVDIDRRGARGRPDLTVFADGATEGDLVPWIVLEAKDERGIAADTSRRAALFAEKAKYITADTAWFVMVEPTTLVARPVENGTDASGDIVLTLATASVEDFAAALAPLAAELAGVPARLDRFRQGDEALIATERLNDPDPLTQRIARDTFFDSLRETTQLLQVAVENALAGTRTARERARADYDAFADEFGDTTFTPYPVGVEGSPNGWEATIAHGRAAHRLGQKLARNPALARLTLNGLPRFAIRVGLDPAKPDEAAQIDRFFAIETANLILARILLIRFLEDHGFFDEVDADGRTVRRRYLCNGGVEAFQGMRAYFGQSYTRLLEAAYRSGAELYNAAFAETELDWVLALPAELLSRTVEWAMYRFARYDFTTIRGDLLTGVYDRFLDPRQRKDKGEFYTPPTIARWMLDRLDLADTDTVFDPACGSGTFLVERYQQAVGEDADRGLAPYEDARAAVERIAGNDLSPFSAVLTQIQLLWHLVTFGRVVRDEGLPELRIAERANSLVPTVLKDQSTTRFGDVDRDDYAAVVGNPPYIRPERGWELDPTARNYFSSTREIDGQAFTGVSAERNIYQLFVYRALDHWCARPEGETPGKLAFVLPLSFCSASDAADLRALFRPGGRWTIREIVDMEMIWRSVFDADVLPMILIAEARVAREDDRVTIHLADERCVTPPAVKGGRPTFDLDQCEVSEVAYPDLFAPDGRILTRLTPERLAVVRKLRAAGRLEDAALRFWTKRGRGGQEVALERPKGSGESRWEEQRLIRYGLAQRGQGTTSDEGLSLWKGENVRAGSLVGEPAFENVDVKTVSSASVWAYPEILPAIMYALPLIEQVPCAAPFNPSQRAMLNTVVVFGPREDLSNFSFDALLLSHIYAFQTMLDLRASYMNTSRSHLYPSVIAALPWSEALVERQGELIAARTRLFDACRRRFEADASLKKEAEALGLQPLRTVFAAHAPDATLGQSPSILDGDPTTVGEVTITIEGDEWILHPDAAEPDAWLSVPDETLARLIVAGLELVGGTELSRTALLNLSIPADAETAARLTDLSRRYTVDALEEAVEREVDAIDAIVGPALGLSAEDIAFVQQEMATDPFLSRIRPRYPYFTPKQRGRRTRLESAERYRAGT